MANPIDFYFDFSSPYGYFASSAIDGIAAKYGRDVVWRPILLGAVFKITGQQPLPTIPLKGSTISRVRRGSWASRSSFPPSFRSRDRRRAALSTG
jgi:2-hydroxychromene-2-carboxylate isomerase